MGVSVVVLTKNSEATTRECLASVSQNNPEEIVIVDGNSTDGTLAIVKEYTDKIYDDEGKGLCYARQLGAEMATEEYIFYVDSDVILPQNTLDAMLTELRKNGYGALTARALTRGGTGYFGWAARRYKNVVNPDRPGVKRATIPMKATIIPRELVLKYGFDLSTPNSDDTSISQRLIDNGHKIAVSGTPVYHLWVPGVKRGGYCVGVATAESFLKHIKSPTWVIRYTLLRGLGSPLWGMVQSVAKGELRLVPYHACAFLVLVAYFTKGLLSNLLSRLRWFNT